MAGGTEALHPKCQEVFPIASCPGKTKEQLLSGLTEIGNYCLSQCFAVGGRAGDEEKQGVW